MKTIFVPAVLALSTGLSTAQEVGRVISSTPVIEQVAQPRQVCGTETVPAGSPRSGAGAAMGAIAGGALGNAVGDGSGRAIATLIGIVGGAMLGDRIEGPGVQQYQNVQHCSTHTVLENRTLYYNVVYEYGGRQYAVQLPRDPGPTVQLQVTPVDAMPPPAPAPSPSYYPQALPPQAVYTQPDFVAVVPQTRYYVQPAPFHVRPYYPPLGINLQFGYTQRPLYRPHHRPYRHHDGRGR